MNTVIDSSFIEWPERHGVLDSAISSEVIPNEQKQNSCSGMFLGASILASIVTIIPTNSTPNYVTNSYYSPTGQQNEMGYENSAFSIIRSYQYFLPNWDGYDGVTPCPDTISDTLAFLEKLPPNTVAPRPGLSGDGEISLFWETNGIFVDIGFIGDDTYAFYAQDNQEVDYFKDSISISSPLPDALLRLI